MEIEQALRLAVAKSPATLTEAPRALRALGRSPIATQRAQRVLEIALTDPQATFTEQERSELAALLAATGDDTRSVDIRLRVTPAEKADIQSMADEAGVNVSVFIRSKIGL
jgi:hypothetical protein